MYTPAVQVETVRLSERWLHARRLACTAGAALPSEILAKCRECTRWGDRFAGHASSEALWSRSPVPAPAHHRRMWPYLDSFYGAAPVRRLPTTEHVTTLYCKSGAVPVPAVALRPPCGSACMLLDGASVGSVSFWCGLLCVDCVADVACRSASCYARMHCCRGAVVHQGRSWARGDQARSVRWFCTSQSGQYFSMNKQTFHYV